MISVEDALNFIYWVRKTLEAEVVGSKMQTQFLYESGFGIGFQLGT